MSINDTVKEWMEAHPDRRVVLTHGGDGGKFYALKENEDGDSSGDGTGDTIEEAIEDAFRGSH